MLKKLRIKFIIISMTMVTLMLVGIFTLLFVTTRENFERDSIRMMQKIAEMPDPPNTTRETSREEPPYVFFVLHFDADGNLTGISGNNAHPAVSDSELLDEIIAEYNASEAQTGVLREYSLRYFRAFNKEGRVAVFADMSGEERMLRSLTKTSSLVALAAFAVFFTVNVLLARWAVKPVDEAWRKQKQFIADASHELKTPLTVISTNAELLSSPDCGEAERVRFSSAISSMSAQMRGLVENLLQLARIDNGGVKENPVRADFSDIVSSAVLTFEPVFFERDMLLSSSVEPEICVKGSPAQLSRLTQILLDNAQKYGASGGKASVTLEKIPHNRCRLTVSNEGDPISAEDLKKLFDRFYRSDKARTQDGSFGLGLSIAKAVAEEHRGRIGAKSEGGVNSFSAELPLC